MRRRIEQTPLERAEHLRRLLIIHSTLYYELDSPLVDDHTFDRWSVELVELVKKHPELREQGDHSQAFLDFDGSTGMHLAHFEWGMQKARRLLAISRAKSLPACQ